MATFIKVSKGWKAEVCVRGRRKAKTWPSKMQAKNWAAETEAELLALPAGQVEAPKQDTTLAELFWRYSEEVSEHKKGARWEIIRLKSIGRDPLGALKLCDLQREHFEAWMARRLRTVKSSTVNRELKLLSNCLTEARRWRLMEHKPLEDLKRPKNPPHRERLIAPGEIPAICAALNYSEEVPVFQQKQRTALAFLLAIETAMRAGEICGIKAAHVNVKKRTVLLPHTKNGTARTVPLSTEALRLLERLQPWPVSDPVLGVTPATLSTLFRKGVAQAGIKGLTFHDSRHEAITRLAKKLDVLDLARMVGHRDIKQLMTYYNKSAEDLAGLLG